MPMFKTIAFAVLVFFAAALPPAAAGTTDPWVEYGRIEPGEITILMDITETPLSVTLEIKNISKRDLNLFSLETGRDGVFYGRNLMVERNGEKLDYAGPDLKIARTKDMYVTLKPEQTFKNTIDLNQYYPAPYREGDIVRLHYDFVETTAKAETKL